MTQPLDPRAAQALAVLSTVRGMLDRYERILRLPGVQHQCNLDDPLRALMCANHYLAGAWNRTLASVPERAPPAPPPPPSAPISTPSVKPSVSRCGADVNLWAERMEHD